EVSPRALPWEARREPASPPRPPLAWSARLVSRIFWYSGVSGACCPSPAGFKPSKLPLPRRCQAPCQSGYCASSNARTPAPDTTSAAASASTPIETRQSIGRLPVIARRRLASVAKQRRWSEAQTGIALTEIDGRRGQALSPCGSGQHGCSSSRMGEGSASQERRVDTLRPPSPASKG